MWHLLILSLLNTGVHRRTLHQKIPCLPKWLRNYTGHISQTSHRLLYISYWLTDIVRTRQRAIESHSLGNNGVQFRLACTSQVGHQFIQFRKEFDSEFLSSRELLESNNDRPYLADLRSARVVSVMCEAFPARIEFNPDDSEHGQGVSPDLDFWIGGKFEKSRRWRGRGAVKIRHGDGVKWSGICRSWWNFCDNRCRCVAEETKVALVLEMISYYGYDVLLSVLIGSVRALSP
jgi:hypothetical protein